MKLAAILRTEPAAVYVTALGTIAALIVAVAHLNSNQAGALATTATAAGALITAFLARPWHVAVIAGAAGTILQALVVFNVPLPPTEIAAVVQVISLILGLVAMRLNLTPTVSLKDGGAAAPTGPAG